MKIGGYINFILRLENEPPLSPSELEGIDSFDDAILILDDIQDESEVRNGNPCYYLVHGKAAAYKEVLRLKQKAFTTLDQIFHTRNRSWTKRLTGKWILYEFWSDVVKGQEIDLRLQKKDYVSEKDISLYFKMVRLFTGNHIKTGFQLGFLLAKKRNRNARLIQKIGQQIGILRQIDDDIKDYDPAHHEPFGDLIQHKKRLPEMLFLLNSSEQEKRVLEDILRSKNLHVHSPKDLVLSESVKGKLRTEIERRFFEIKTANQMVDASYMQELEKMARLYNPSL